MFVHDPVFFLPAFQPPAQRPPSHTQRGNRSCVPHPRSPAPTPHYLPRALLQYHGRVLLEKALQTGWCTREVAGIDPTTTTMVGSNRASSRPVCGGFFPSHTPSVLFNPSISYITLPFLHALELHSTCIGGCNVAKSF